MRSVDCSVSEEIGYSDSVLARDSSPDVLPRRKYADAVYFVEYIPVVSHNDVLLVLIATLLLAESPPNLRDLEPPETHAFEGPASLAF